MKLRFTGITVLLFVLTGCFRVDNESERLRCENYEKDIECIYAGIDLSQGPICLDDAICIALNRNMELLVRELEYEIQMEIACGEKTRMLPNLVANWEKTSRNKNTGSTSESLTDRPPAPPSIAREQHLQRWDVTATWNLIDFGLAYYRTRQEMNRGVIREMEYERIRQNLILDVVRQYWRTAATKMVLAKAEEIRLQTLKHREKLQKNSEDRVISKTASLEKEDQLLAIDRRLMIYEKNYTEAKKELARLMGIPAGCEYEVCNETMCELNTQLDDLCTLEQWALLNRPELYGSDMEGLISIDEARSTILRMLPSASLFGGANSDSNKFLVYNHWMEAGVRATWNILQIPYHLRSRSAAQIQQERHHANRLAISVSAITQVHLGYHTYMLNVDEYKKTKEHWDVRSRLHQIAVQRKDVGLLPEADLIEYKAQELDLEAAAWEAYGNAQIALELLNNALGLPLHYRNECHDIVENTLVCEEHHEFIAP